MVWCYMVTYIWCKWYKLCMHDELAVQICLDAVLTYTVYGCLERVKCWVPFLEAVGFTYPAYGFLCFLRFYPITDILYIEGSCMFKCHTKLI